MCILRLTIRIALESKQLPSSNDEDDGPSLQSRRLNEIMRENHEVCICIHDATAAKDIERIPGMVCRKTF